MKIKRHTSFFLFHFWDLKLVLVDSALNSASGNLTHFLKKVYAWYQEKQPKLKIQEVDRNCVDETGFAKV